MKVGFRREDFADQCGVLALIILPLVVLCLQFVLIYASSN